jgi:peptide/nickel transport system permease protein
MQKKQPSRWYYYLVGTWIILGLFAPLLANQRPLFCIEHNKIQFPAYREIFEIPDTTFSRNWLTYSNYERVIRAPIPYSAENCIDLKNRETPPFIAQNVPNAYYYHYLGTDINGVDVMAYMLYGWHNAVKIGIFSMLIAFFIGVLLGMSAAYWGNQGIRINQFQVMLNVLLVAVFSFYAFIMPLGNCLLKLSISLLFLFFINAFLNKHKRFSLKTSSAEINIPLDDIVLRSMDLLNSIPKILLLLALASVLHECRWWHIALLIGCLFWTAFARLARAETLRLKAQPFVESAQASGLYAHQIIVRHILPNAMPSLKVLLAFGIGSAILAEASMAFLGLNINAPSWGILLHQANENTNAWWLAVFPGLAIFLTLLLFNSSEN